MKLLAWFIVVYFWCFSTGVLAQDVVEVETDIGMDQLKESSVLPKTGIKPRASYKETPPADKTKMSARQEAIDAQMNDLKTAPVRDADSDTEEIETESLESSLPVKASEPALIKVPENALTDVQVVEISGSLRNLIEENENLKQELDKLDEQLKTVRGQQKLESNRMAEVALERDALRKQNESIVALGKEAQENLSRVQAQLTEKEQEYNLQIIRLQTELANVLRVAPPEGQAAIDPALTPGAVPAIPVAEGLDSREPTGRTVSVDIASTPSGLSGEELKQKSEKVLMALDTVAQEKVKLTRDEAKLHYNMGNTFFNQGDYQRAAKEYGLAVKLAPEDANAHYNLAFVSGEFLNDPVIALEHYKQYLFLNPGAEDAVLVRQKMIDAEILTKADIHFKSTIDKEVQKKKNEYNEATPF